MCHAVGSFWCWLEISDRAYKPDWPWGILKAEPLKSSLLGWTSVLLFCWGLLSPEQVAPEFKVFFCFVLFFLFFFSAFVGKDRRVPFLGRSGGWTKKKSHYIFFIRHMSKNMILIFEIMNYNYMKLFHARKVMYDRQRLKYIQNPVCNFQK